ncbi:hypothetical protein M1D72_01720 [Vibrio sp. AK197]
MGFRFIQYLWFTLLAMVLPSQALAYLTLNESEPSSRLLVSRGMATTESHIDQLESVSSSVEFETAASAQQRLIRSTWKQNPRIDIDNGLSDSLHFFAPFGAFSVDHRVECNTCWFHQTHANSHRLSSWKETNAFYVALNSQY